MPNAWFTQFRQNNTPKAGSIFKEKAKLFAISLSTTNFQASKSWLEKS